MRAGTLQGPYARRAARLVAPDRQVPRKPDAPPPSRRREDGGQARSLREPVQAVVWTVLQNVGDEVLQSCFERLIEPVNP
eukprot:SAG31_NODE_569_length_14020_cov_11.049565_14_plen_80_part_00